MFVVFCRHSETDKAENPDDPPLSDRGRALVDEAATWIRTQELGVPNLVISSKWVRCRETASILAYHLGVADDQLRVRPGIPATASRLADLVAELVAGVGPEGKAVLVGSHPSQQLVEHIYLRDLPKPSRRVKPVVYVIDTELGESVASWWPDKIHA